jgi:hypothetical protein
MRKACFNPFDARAGRLQSCLYPTDAAWLMGPSLRNRAKLKRWRNSREEDHCEELVDTWGFGGARPRN